MQFILPPPYDPVFFKTEKGKAEVTQRSHGLNARQRRALIIIDGKKTLGALGGVLPQEELKETIPFLANQGFIAVEGGKSSDAPLVTMTLEKKQDEGLQEAKKFMISVAQSCLGMLASDLVKRIERVERIGQLAQVAGYWVAALRDSKFGVHLSERYLDQLKKALPELELR